jgi:hypothetical protein
MSDGRHLHQKIEAWVDEGLISPYQAQSIHEFETKQYRVGRKYVRRFAWQLLAFFLLALGSVTLLAANWTSWGLPFRLMLLFGGIGGFQWLAWCLFQGKIPVWIQDRLGALGVRSAQYPDLAVGLFFGTAMLGMLLLSRQYPFAPPLWVSLSWLVWVLLPLVLWLRRDVGMLLVGILAVFGTLLAPSEKHVLLLFPYWFVGFFGLGRSQGSRWMTVCLTLVWVGAVGAVLWPLCHVFWYWPLLGGLMYLASLVLGGQSRILLRMGGIGLALGWSVLAMWWTPPLSLGAVILAGICLLGLWLNRQSLRAIYAPQVSDTGVIGRLLAHPEPLWLLFLCWTLGISALHILLPQGHAAWGFFHALLALGLSLVLAWTRDRSLRILGLVMLVSMVGILLVQPIFPNWMRGFLMVSGGFGLWVFLRMHRDGGRKTLSFSEGLPVVTLSPMVTKVFQWRTLSSVWFKPGLLLLLVLQLAVIAKPVWIYEWVRLMGERYRMPAQLQDVYSPFRGPYLQLKMTSFETAWPVALPEGTRYAYLQMRAKGNVIQPQVLSKKAPRGLYLRIPVKWKSTDATVTKSPFEKVFVPESKRAALKKEMGRDAVIWLHVKVKHGYAVLEYITVGEKK